MRKLALAALALALPLAAAGAAQPAGMLPSEAPAGVASLKKGMWDLWDARRFPEAVSLAKQVLALSPGDAEARAVLADEPGSVAAQRVPALRESAGAAWRSGRRQTAIALLRRALALAPGDYLTLRDLMWALWRSGRESAALEPARRILALRPGDREAAEIARLAPSASEDRVLAGRYARAKELLSHRRAQAAAAELRALIASRPGRWEYRRALVAALRDAGRGPEALAEARTLARLRPDDAEAVNPLGLLQARLADPEAARRTLSRSLELKPDQPAIQLALGVVELRLRDFASAERTLRPLEASADRKIAAAAAWPLGQTLFWLGRYAQALPRLDAAAKTIPDPADALYYKAWALLRLDRVEEGRSLLEPMVSRAYPKAFSLLFDDALARGDVQRALTLGRHWLARMTAADEALALRLAEILRNVGRVDDSQALLDRLVQVVPLSQGAWLAKSEIALEKGRLADAKRFALKARDINPAAQDWHAKLRDVAGESGDRAEAYRQAMSVAAYFPSDPRNILRSLGELYQSGRRAEARRRLAAWLGRAEKTVPILLFHGLTESETDPLLAYEIHESTRTFDDQLRALKEAGYVSVSVRDVDDWLRGGRPLPDKAVLITFDDARADSLILGDPILARYGFKATMMAALVNVDGPSHAPAYASWDMLEAYAATGRWDIQAHGDLAHVKIPMDPAGRSGLFLVNRRWDASKGRLESEGEWRARLERDYAECRRRIAQRLGRVPIAYAFPEGAAGQKGDVSNAPEALEVNRALVSKYYRLAFFQDDHGINTRDRDPHELVRLEPGKLSGRELLGRFADGQPKALADVMLIDWALKEKRFDEARRILGELRAMGASPALLSAEEASIRYYAGDLDGALPYAREAARLSADGGPARLAERVEAERRPAWAPAYDYYTDNERRRTWTLTQALESPAWGRLRARAIYQRSEFLEGGSLFVGDNALGAGADLRVADAQVLKVAAAGHRLSGPVADFASASGEWDAQWPGAIETWVKGSRTLMYSARAVLDGVWRRGGDIGARWAPDGPWSLAARAQRDWYSDRNTRSTLQGEAGRDMVRFDRLALRGLYRFVYDASPLPSADYYAPRFVTLHGVGPEVLYVLTPGTRLEARYLASRGAEHGVPPAFVSEARAAVSTRWRQADTLELSFDYDRTPTYRSETVSAAAAIRF